MDAVGTGPGWGALLWFLFVLAAIPLVLWVLKRTQFGALAGAAPGTARLVGVLPLSAAQRIVTIEVGQGEDRRWLVLGVTAQQIQTLHTLPASDAPPLSAPSIGGGFAAMLARARPSPGPGHER